MSVIPCVQLVTLLMVLSSVNAELPLQDATATVNQIFQYKMNPEDFPDQQIQVTESGQSTLPSWLEFDSNQNELVGVPTSTDKGTYILKAGKEMFAVTVVDPSKNQVAQPTNSNDQIVCKPHDSITVVYVKLNADANSLPAMQKSRLVRSISTHLSLKPNHISISARPKDLLDASAALVSGAGDLPPSEDGLSVLSWIVGCGAVKSHHMDILERLESSAKDGSMGKLLTVPVSGWQVQSNQPRVMSKRRLKRMVITATPVPSSSVTGEDTTTMSSSVDEPSPSVEVVTPSRSVPQPITTPVQTVPKPAVTPSQSTPEPTTAEPTNMKPELNKIILPRIYAQAGELVRLGIPNNLFVDPEGGELTYSIQYNSSTGDNWIMTREIRGRWELLGVTRSVSGNGQITLIATDPAGARASANIPIEFTNEAEFLTEMYTFDLKALGILRRPEAIIYLALTLQGVTESTSLLYHPLELHNTVLSVKFGTNRGEKEQCPRRLNQNFLSELRRKENEVIPIVGTDEQFVMPSLGPVLQLPPCSDSNPMVNGDLLSLLTPLKIRLGELFEVVLPDNLFTDYEDENLRRLSIELKVQSTNKAGNWITLDPETRKLQAFTLVAPDDTAQYSLLVTDYSRNTAEEEITIETVDNSDSEPATNQFTLTFDTDYTAFTATPRILIDMYKRLNNVFPGSTVTINSLSKGSVVLKYSVRANGDSSPPDQCPMDAVESFMNTVFDGKKVRKSFSDGLGSYDLGQVDFVPLGPCEDKIKPKTVIKQTPTGENRDEGSKSNITPIIIAVVIVVLVLVIIIAIVVYCVRKRRAEKANTQQNGSYIEKGVPVRLDEELKTIEKSESQPLMSSAEVNYKPTRTPPAYPGEKPDGYQPDTPPVSEPDDEQRIIDRSP